VLRVLQVTCNLESGGAESLSVNVSCALRQLGHSVELTTIDQFSGSPYELTLLEKLERHGVPVSTLGRKPHTGLTGLYVLPRLAKILHSGHYDIVHSHLLFADIMVGLAKRLAGFQTAHVVTVHNTKEPWGKLAALKVGRPHVVYCSRSAQLSGRHPARTSTVIPNGVEHEVREIPPETVAALRAELKLPQTCPVVISVGHLKPAKNYSAAVRAIALAAAQQDLHYVACGGGDSHPFETLASMLGIGGWVHFLGKRTDVRELLALADCFLSASLREGMPVAVLEAFSAGLPCVLSPIPEHIEIADGMPGCSLAESSSTESLAKGLKEALAVRREKGELRDARRDCLAPYDIRRCAQSYAEYYSKVIGQAPPAVICVEGSNSISR
jgi:glycosyltransferase involved in cell wall biosynthesis